MIKDVSFKCVFVIYLALAITDFITTYATGLTDVFEVNPLFKWLGTMWPVYLLNAFMLLLLWWLYTREKSSPTTRFFVINIMMIIMLARAFAIYNAFHWIQHPVTVEQARTIATQAAIQQSQKIYAFISYAPLVISLLTFFGWKFDHRITRRR